MTGNLLSVLVFLPLAGALILLMLPRENHGLIRSMAGGTALLTLGVSLFAWSRFDGAASGMQLGESYPWIDFGMAAVRYELGVDGLSMPLLVLTTVIAAIAVLASVKITERVKEYFVWMLVLTTGLLGVFTALDLFLFFLFFELTLIPVFFLISIWGGKERNRAAFKFLLYTGLGSAVMFVAFIALAFTGAEAAASAQASFNMIVLADMFANPAIPEVLGTAVRAGLFAAVVLAFAVKLPVFPLHTWLPAAYTQAPVPVTMILAGVMSKMGAYGVLRVGYGILPDQAATFAAVIAIFGVINIIYGACLALVQTDLKMLIAYGSMSHMGIILLGAASYTQAGMQGAIFQMVSHGLIAALLFFIAGALYERTKTGALSELGGLSRSVPVLAGFMLAAAMASLGLPGLSGFVSELLAFMGIFGAGDLIPAAAVIGIIGVIGMILTAGYLLIAVQRTAFGEMKEQFKGLPDVRPGEYVPLIGLLGLSILIGVYPNLLSDIINTTVIDIITRAGG
ncbi:complex I subunit 4 family protein [Alteribacter natronophilus]|uniref:complex I subunit 4 family protein n=1 Tax=Alteribacter natronophilus TaxID=2583810 RepID=UPI00110D9741|nr:NADH-quinone oxidoreductase subunit M [Alteribacter natronophilus]TMW72181.1 NADH-quinone oxidoreductase subunit M [Alteribacter natronophilus]